MRKRAVTKKLIDYIGELTNNLYKESVMETIGLDPSYMTEELLETMLMQIRISSIRNQDHKIMSQIREQSSELYLTKILQLSTKDLEAILLIHDNGKIKRMARTLEAINSELARRFIIDDSSQSDAIDNTGDTGAKRKSRTNSKKAISKGRKTNKDKPR